MKRIFKISIFLLFIQVSSFALATPETTFNTFKAFKGKWTIEADGKSLPFEMIYEDGSKNSIVTEQFGKELSVLYRDGKSLLMTHFCNAGNQPRLKYKESKNPETLEFHTFEVTNLKSLDEPHVQKIIYRILSGKRVELELVWKKGNSQESEKYVLYKK